MLVHITKLGDKYNNLSLGHHKSFNHKCKKCD